MILAAAETAYPDECCGLLVGRRRPGAAVEVTRAVPADNTAAGDRRDRFEVDPRVRLALQRDLRGRDETIVGHYHSHPDAPPEPSATDRAQVHEPDLIWLIVGVAEGRAESITAWRFDPTHRRFAACALHRGPTRNERDDFDRP